MDSHSNHMLILKEQYQDRLNSLYQFIYQELPTKLMSEEQVYEDLQSQLYNLVEQGLVQENERKISILIDEYATLRMDNSEKSEQIAKLQTQLQEIQEQQHKQQQIQQKENINNGNQSEQNSYRNMQRKHNRGGRTPSDVEDKVQQLHQEKSKFLDEIKDLSNSSSQKSKNQYIMEIQGLKKQIKQLQSQLGAEESKSETHLYRNKIDSIQQQFSDELSQAKQREFLAQKKLSEVEERLRNTTLDNEQSFSLEKTKIQELQSDLQKYQQKLELSENSRNELIATLKQIQLAYDECQGHHQQQQENLKQQYQATLNEQQQHNEELAQQLDSAEQTLETFNTEYESILHDKQHLLQSLEQEAEINMRLQETINELQSQTDQYSQQVQQLNSQIQAGKKETEHLKLLLEAKSQDFRVEIQRKNDIISRIKQQRYIKKVQQQIISKNTNCLKQELLSLKMDLKATFNGFQGRLTSAKGDIMGRILHSLQQLQQDQEYKEIQTADQYNDQIDRLKAQYQDLLTQCQLHESELQETISNQQLELQDLQNDLQTRDALDTHNERRVAEMQQQYKAEMKDQQMKIDALEANLQQCQKQLKQFSQDFMKLNDENSTKFQIWQDTVQKLTRQIEEKQDTITKLKNELAQISTQNHIALTTISKAHQQGNIGSQQYDQKELNNVLTAPNRNKDDENYAQRVNLVKEVHRTLPQEERESLSYHNTHRMSEGYKQVKVKLDEPFQQYDPNQLGQRFQQKDHHQPKVKTRQTIEDQKENLRIKSNEIQNKYKEAMPISQVPNDKESELRCNLSAQKRQIEEFKVILEQTKKKFSRQSMGEDQTMKEVPELQKYRRSVSRTQR